MEKRGTPDCKVGVGLDLEGPDPGTTSVVGAFPPFPEQPWAPDVAVQPRLEALPQVQRDTLAETRQAEAQLPYVSRWYFLNRWRGPSIPADPRDREQVLVELVVSGLVEEYQATGASARPTAAIRTRPG